MDATASGPNLFAIDPWTPGNSIPRRAYALFSEEQSAKLATIASLVRFKRRETIYQAGEQAGAAFVIRTGVVKTFRVDGNGVDRIAAFLLDGDVFGLSEEGLYTNSAAAVTDVTAYRLPFHAVRSRLSADAALDLQIISKFVHELRASQRHAFILGERHADSKLAMFLQMLEQHQASRRQDVDEIYLPMSRQDIGEYLAVTPAAITRSFHNLSRAGVVSCRNLHHARVLDRRSFERVAAGNTAIKKTTRS